MLSGGVFIARRAGEKTTGYAERAYSLINRYQFSEGRLRGLVLGLDTTYQEKYRAYMYNDMLDGNRRVFGHLARHLPPGSLAILLDVDGIRLQPVPVANAKHRNGHLGVFGDGRPELVQ